MAAPNASPKLSTILVNSHDTALCIVPPKHIWPSVERLRALYDQAYEKWPPHVNLIYPFVRPDQLPIAAEAIEYVLSQPYRDQEEDMLRVSLDAGDVFKHKHDNTIYLHDSDEARSARLANLRRDVLRALGHSQTGGYQMHMTVAQSEDAESSAHKFLLDKVRLLPAVAWDVGQICILVRERLQLNGSSTSQMKIWATINISDAAPVWHRPEQPLAFYDDSRLLSSPPPSDDDAEIGAAAAERDRKLMSRPTYCFRGDLWVPLGTGDRSLVPGAQATSTPEPLAISSYNVLAEFEWPPSGARYPHLLKNMLTNDSSADVWVLQEVTDSFLSFLLDDDYVREELPFVSHGPPDQPDIDPLPSLLNTVVLSKHAFDWEHVAFHRKHKGAVVAKFRGIGKTSSTGEFLPTVVAAVHMTRGLTDGAVAAKKAELQRIIKHLSSTYPDNPWVVAGDFNIPTSSYTIDAALEKKTISAQSASQLASFDTILADAGLEDAWLVAKAGFGDGKSTADYVVDQDYIDNGDELFEGEQGATYDPLVNGVAAAIVGSGSNLRPQRYDRVLVRGEGFLHITGFNKFGFRKSTHDEDELEPSYASDHWGVRCGLGVGEGNVDRPAVKQSDEISSLVVPVHMTTAPETLSAAGTVKECLADLGVIPTEEEIAQRKAAFDLLRSVILDTPSLTTPRATSTAAATSTDPKSSTRSQPRVVIVPVGSYGLGVWTAASDIDVLAIGPFSSNTFFALAVHRLRKAAQSNSGIKILRRVKAHTGTMLELEIQDVKMDLQYCPAASVAEEWPLALRSPSSLLLPAQTLSKLKAIREADYLRRSVPDIVTFRLAHRFIKTWAKSRGIYTARFGFLGGHQISLLLARVCKLVPHAASVSVGDLLVTFFAHYAGFNWARDLAFDPLFHSQRLPYTRNPSREPLAILGYFPPSLNTALAASVPSARTMADEFRRAADALLLRQDKDDDDNNNNNNNNNNLTWRSFLQGDAAADFLTAYKSYVKIDVQYWGLGLSKGAQFVGWVESRCVMLLVDLARRAPGLYVRMWPARFVELDESNDSNTEEETTTKEARDYRGSYLIGLDKLRADALANKDDLKAALAAVQTALRRFEENMRTDDRYFDAKSCWLSAGVAKRSSELSHLVLDARDWGRYTPGGDEESDSEGEDCEEEEEDYEEEEEEISKKKNNKKALKEKTEKGKGNPNLEPGKKLRTAADVMSRLRWDPGFDAADYIVGYEDRFLGTRERALDAWKTEQTDEEFIPQHRIVYFKRRSDGEVVWERKTRRDGIFGSGGGAGDTPSM
ncbi:2'-5' RNA ligase superfamily-domain-containing protein [Podospora didyma]|uniref:polynucleotide adenylyltransferase n=1 Tax=Podospora didyma TaxID=330526 RepID=A0AAE0U4Q5_9PEZI|nr:2'-5' RNA ligase superfamily-domain-containing protein [Podospora didyma]